MLKHALLEKAGVPLHVQYSVDVDGVLQFHSVQACAADYAPCGSNLVELLHACVVQVEPNVFEPFLSTLVTEILDEQRPA